MAEMRLLEKLRAQILTDYEYTWDATYNHILMRKDLNADVRRTEETTVWSFNLTESKAVSCTWGNKSYYFIFPHKYRYKTILDGVAYGNIRLQVHAGAAGGYVHCTVKSYTVLSIVAIDVNGSKRILGSSQAPPTASPLSASHNNGHAYLTADLPFFITIDNAVINETERIVLQCDIYYCRERGYWSEGVRTWGDVKFYTRLNTDDLFIEIPIVP